MSRNFQKPEAAIKRADELIKVGKEQDALNVLHEAIKSSRRQKIWSQPHEDLMMKHMLLCNNLRKPHVAKDALFQFKALTQQTYASSLEKVVTFYLSVAEQRADEAQKMSIEKVEEIDDLDQGDTPEHLLMAVVSAAAAQDRMDRTVLAPWLRFLWDSFRNCLELLRNNFQVESLYHKVAAQAMTFCRKFERRAEFRKLTEILRLHLGQIQKHQGLAHAVKLSSPESLLMMQETRLLQLETSISMELWQEAYKSSEDVHGIMQLSKDKDRRIVKPISYVNYYDKLALIFWKADNQLFHAAALLQKYVIYKDMKKSFALEDAQEQATRVLLAALSIPDGADSPRDLTRLLDVDEQHAVNVRVLTSLLRLTIAPTREGILREAARLGILEMATHEAQALYKLMEKSFTPNRLVTLAENEFQKIAALQRHDQYISSLRNAFATRALRQISVIYNSLSWSRLRSVLSFDDIRLEHFLVDVSKRRFIKANIDHRSNCVNFGSYDEATLAGNVDLEETSGFTGDSTQLGIDGVRSHLEQMYHKLQEMIEWLDGDKIRARKITQIKKFAGIYLNHKNDDYGRIQQRKRKIESYKETTEKVKGQKQAQEIAQMNILEEQRRLEERKRLEKLSKEHEVLRQKSEQEEVQKLIRADKIRKLQASSMYQNMLKEYTEEELTTLDPDELVREQRTRVDAERQKQQQRYQQQWRNFDHMVRAFHLEESMDRRAVDEVKSSKLPKLFDEYEKRRVATAILDHENAVKFWKQSQAVSEDAVDWVQSVKDGHTEDFKAKMQEFHEKLDAVRKARLQERTEMRRVERRLAWKQQKRDEEKARLKAEEEAKKQKSEADRQERYEQRMRERQGYGANSHGAINRSGGTRGSDFFRKDSVDASGQRQGPSAADTDSSWRDSMIKSQPKPTSAPVAGTDTPRHYPAPTSSIADTDSRWRERAPAEAPHYKLLQRNDHQDERGPLSKETEDAGPWRRGQFVKSSPVEDGSTAHDENKLHGSIANKNQMVEDGGKAEKAAMSNGPPTTKTGKYVPPSRRNEAVAPVLTETTNRPEETEDDEGFTEVKGKNKHRDNALPAQAVPTHSTPTLKPQPGANKEGPTSAWNSRTSQRW